MSYTNINLVRRHISLENPLVGRHNSLAVVFDTSGEIVLPGGGIAPEALVVKAVRSSVPEYENRPLADTPLTLAGQDPVPGSVTLASDRSLGRLYVENVDYTVDYGAAKITRLPDGDIASGAKVAIWYYNYSRYREGLDYTVAWADSLIRRLPGGEIRVGQTVYVDYGLTGSSLNDNVMRQAVAEANAIVAGEIDSGRAFGSDLTLQTAATYLAVSILCRVAAADGLNRLQAPARNAESWLALAEHYRGDYERLIKLFRPRVTGLKQPTRA